MKGEIKVKKSCCRSSPRCKRCPVVWKRLERGGCAERTGKRTYETRVNISRQTLRVARSH